MGPAAITLGAQGTTHLPMGALSITPDFGNFCLNDVVLAEDGEEWQGGLAELSSLEMAFGHSQWLHSPSLQDHQSCLLEVALPTGLHRMPPPTMGPSCARLAAEDSLRAKNL